MSYAEANAQTGLGRGLDALLQNLSEVEKRIHNACECLGRLNGRLYEPRPEPANPVGSEVPTGETVESKVRALNLACQRLEDCVSRLQIG